MTEPVDPAGGMRRASLVVAGRSIARHQLEVALALRAAMVVCLVDAPSPELTLLRAEVENAGARFAIAHDIQDVRTLCAAGDELLVIADGLLADTASGVELMRVGPGVLVQPADIGLPLGFERLDLGRAAGGMLLVPAALLADVPDGYDLFSGLTRIALQAGVPTREVAEQARQGGHWRLVRTEDEARAIDDAWITSNLSANPGASPGEALARAAIRAFGSTLLGAGTGSRLLALASGVLLMLALSAGWFDASVLGFALVVLGSIVGRGALLLLRVERGAATTANEPGLAAATLDGVTDAVLLLLMIWAAPPFPSQMLTGRAFAPLMLIGLVRLGSNLYAARFARLLADRAGVAMALLIAAALQSLPAGVELFALALAFGASIHLTFGIGRRH